MAVDGTKEDDNEYGHGSSQIGLWRMGQVQEHLLVFVYINRLVLPTTHSWLVRGCSLNVMDACQEQAGLASSDFNECMLVFSATNTAIQSQSRVDEMVVAWYVGT